MMIIFDMENSIKSHVRSRSPHCSHLVQCLPFAVIVALLPTGQCLPATIDMATRQHSYSLHPPSIIHIIVSDVLNIIFKNDEHENLTCLMI